MKIKKEKDDYIVRIDRGEEVISSLKKVCKENNISSGFITGIGAADKVETGLYKVSDKKYLSDTKKGEFEITNITGNVSEKDNEVYLHLHATLTDESGKAFGGHLNFARISGTCEILIHEIKTITERKTDKKTGLNIYKL